MRSATARIAVAAAHALEQKQTVEKEVTERKRSEALLRGILDSAPVGIWMLDRDGYITATNAASNSIWGMPHPHGVYHINICKGWWLDTQTQIPAEEWPASRADRPG